MFAANHQEEFDPHKSKVYKFMKNSLPLVPHDGGGKYIVRENGKPAYTTLFVVVIMLAAIDVVFAVDSIPAIFAIAPDDPLILYTSNIFAILGLRALYFLLANFIHMFSLLKYGLAVILSFIGVKMVIAPIYHISSPLSLSIVGGVLVLSVIATLVFVPKEK